MRNLHAIQIFSAAALAWSCGYSAAFAPCASRLPASVSCSPPLALAAKKRRRRKKPTDSPSSGGASGGDLPDFDLDADGGGADLPDFDLDDDPPAAAKASKSTPATPANLNTVTDEMIGTPMSQMKSVDDLIRDRSLESKLTFDDSEVDLSIPDFDELARSSPSAAARASGAGADGAGMTKKEQREARRVAAIAEREERERREALISKIPFITNDQGEVTPLSILEAGTWLGISLLIVWEVYINSPFFERAAPMAPIVYDFLL